MQRLAELIGTSHVHLHRLEMGKSRVSIEWMEKIAAALGCAAADLLPGAEDAGVVELYGIADASGRVSVAAPGTMVRSELAPRGLLAIQVPPGLYPGLEGGGLVYAEREPVPVEEADGKRCLVEADDRLWVRKADAIQPGLVALSGLGADGVKAISDPRLYPIKYIELR